MNHTLSTEHEYVSNGYLFIIIAFIFFGMLCLLIVKLLLNILKAPEITIAYPVVIEIPLAVSISTQTVDNEHIGVVI